jgi:DNA polymerase-3 subunit gamma/tau
LLFCAIHRIFATMSESDPDQTEASPDPVDPDQGSMFGDAETGIAPSYQVLARKYRPANFDDLIGQEPMVHTLSNAFAANRIAHAFMLTGVRGVGKTTTARLLARALNFEDESGAHPNMQLEPPGVHCAEISASRHMDVMEMDAASHTGIGDIRDILDGVRYAPVSAHYKVYIIDEVHMLSKQAFNALLKTLEEPPPHAIFILATTEIRKVPITILSRCQRFDLSRVDVPAMVKHLARICEQEQRQVSEKGLRLIARASEGSVRDALSILDQALVQSDDGAEVAAEDIRVMLGLADRSRVLNLFALTMAAKAPEALQELREQYDLGADPAVIATDLLDHCHQITRAKALGEAADLTEYGPNAKTVRKLADDFTMGQLSRCWQMLLKASTEIKLAPDPLAAAEMALIRLMVAADLPPPEDAAKLARGEAPVSAPKPAAETPATTAPSPVAPSTSAPAPVKSGSDNTMRALAPEVQARTEPTSSLPHSFEALLQLVEEARELPLLSQLEHYVHLISYQPGAVTFAPAQKAPNHLAAELSKQLQELTGERWLISPDSQQKGAPTKAQTRKKAQEQEMQEVLAEPDIQAIFEAFPGAKITRIFRADEEENQS